MILSDIYSKINDATIVNADCLDFLKQVPDKEANLIITSPPYNLGKVYEKPSSIESYLANQEQVISECVRSLSDTGSICWQVGNHIAKDGEVIPLDIILYPIFKKYGLKLKNRIVWHFAHGLHCSKRFSGRYETILWFVKSDDYFFNVDPVRVPQKYPNKKYFKGKNKGKLSCNPLGKNPGDVWVIPNVKHNHCEKTIHPCQFPIELVSRLVLSMTRQGDLVIDPYMGVGTSLCSAVMNKRRGAGSDICKEYVDLAKERLVLAFEGKLKNRPIGKEIYQPKN